MKKSKKGIFSKFLIFFITLMAICIISFSTYFIKVTYSAKLDETKLVKASQTSSIKVFDASKEELDTGGIFLEKQCVTLSALPSYVPKAFIAIEDKRFYSHHGVDYIRMAGAMLRNIKNGKAKEGASTISQQLIKNTHLSQEKTIERKFKEIKLAYKLESKFSKEEILEMYLNNIYFGNGCYGLEKASKFYFNKPASELSLGEGAMLAGVINAPAYYDPISKNDNAEKRKNLVLKLMLNNEFITDDEYQKSANLKENIVKNASKQQNQHIKAILSEACNVLRVNENQLKNMGVNIYTTIDSSIQKEAESIVQSNAFLPSNENGKKPSAGIIVVDNKNKQVVAFAGNMQYSLLKHKRQPGSSFKPIIVYAPALESGKYTPESIVVDEPININGYSPSNASKTYSGAVSLRTAVEKSLNVPAVKILSNVGVNYAKNFAGKIGITFEKQDQNLALALGGMTSGVTIKQLADAYSTFASSGRYCESSFIEEIESFNGKILYKRNKVLSNAMDESTAYLVTDILKGVVKRGTAKRLNGCGYQLASKTGTVGKQNSTLNTDAYNVSYTSEHTIVSHLEADGVNEYMSSSVNGATYPTEMAKQMLLKLYATHSPADFLVPSSVGFYDIDTRSLLDNKVELAGEDVLEKFKKKVLLSENNLPPVAKNFEPHETELKVNMEENQKPSFNFDTKKENSYKLFRENVINNKKELVTKVDGNNSSFLYTDENAKSGEIYEYYIVVTNNESSKEKLSNIIKLMSY